jgi:hypothetical protein
MKKIGIGYDYVSGQGWGTYAIADETMIITCERVEVQSATELRHKVQSIAKAIEASYDEDVVVSIWHEV